MKYLFDTNAVIYTLKGVAKPLFITSEDMLHISFISKIELLSHPSKNEEREKIEQFLENVLIVLINDSLINKTVEIRIQHGLKLPDAVIAATAILHDATLITSDEKIIKKASGMGMRVINPLQ